MGIPDVHNTLRQLEWLRPHGTRPEAGRPTDDRFGRPTVSNDPLAKDRGDNTRAGPRPARSPSGPFVTHPAPAVRTSVAADPVPVAHASTPPVDTVEPDLTSLLAQVVRRFRQTRGEAHAEFEIDGMRVTLEDSFLGQLGPLPGH